MAEETLVKGLKDWAAAHKKQNRPFSLLMLVPASTGSVDRYSLVASAPWLDEKAPREAVSELLKELIQEFGSTRSPAYQSLARVTIPRSTDPLVRNLNSAFSTESSRLDLVNTWIGSTHLDRAILIESKSRAGS